MDRQRLQVRFFQALEHDAFVALTSSKRKASRLGVPRPGTKISADWETESAPTCSAVPAAATQQQNHYHDNEDRFHTHNYLLEKPLRHQPDSTCVKAELANESLATQEMGARNWRSLPLLDTESVTRPDSRV